MRILIVETSWAAIGLSHRLCADKMPVTRCETLDEAEEYASMGQQDVFVVDASVPLSVLRRIREAAGDTPLCLLMHNYVPAEAAELLQAGADDVIDARAPHELLTTRILSVARRALGAAHPRIECGPLHFDLLRRRAYLFDCPMTLSPKLYETLEHLTLRRDRMVSKDQLLSHIYAQQDEPSQRVFDVYICKLRSLLAATDGRVEIVTSRAKGYRLTLSGCREASVAAPMRHMQDAMRRKSDMAA